MITKAKIITITMHIIIHTIPEEAITIARSENFPKIRKWK